MAGNVLRGALGSTFREIACAEECPGRAGKHIHECEHRASCPYARIFEPAATGAGPSGLSDWPRPFVIRCAALNGRIVQPGERFCFSLNLFDLRNPALDHFTRALAQWADLVSVEHSEVAVDLSPPNQPVSRIRVEFQTPTELKRPTGIGIAEFPLLLARARDRVSTLRSLYGTGPLEIDFRGVADRARSVKALRSELRHVAVERRSSRTGQRHGIGGVVGFAEYEGDLAEFTPYLEAASWAGVGRHCTWGNGQIQTEILNSEF
jgi:hypothetical protein